MKLGGICRGGSTAEILPEGSHVTLSCGTAVCSRFSASCGWLRLKGPKITLQAPEGAFRVGGLKKYSIRGQQNRNGAHAQNFFLGFDFGNQG